MQKVVIDTNIIISAALSQSGNPAKIINLIADSEEMQVYYSADILSEYKEVLSREHLKIASDTQINIINVIKETGRVYYDTYSFFITV